MLQTLHKNLHTDVDSSFIHNHQKPEGTQTQMSLKLWYIQTIEYIQQ